MSLADMIMQHELIFISGAGQAVFIFDRSKERLFGGGWKIEQHLFTLIQLTDHPLALLQGRGGRAQRQSNLVSGCPADVGDRDLVESNQNRQFWATAVSYVTWLESYSAASRDSLFFLHRGFFQVSNLRHQLFLTGILLHKQ